MRCSLMKWTHQLTFPHECVSKGKVDNQKTFPFEWGYNGKDDTPNDITAKVWFQR